MALQDWNLKATFDGAYSYNAAADGHPNTRPAVMLHYQRGAMRGVSIPIANYFANYIGPAAFNRRFVIVGGGFGWVADELLDRGFTNIVTAETSAWIIAEMDNDDEQEVRDACAVAGLDPNGARADELVTRHARPGVPRRRRKNVAEDIQIVNADIGTVQGRNAIKSAVGGNPQIVVTEEVMGCLTDAEAIALDDACNAFGGQQTTAHLVTPSLPNNTQDPGYNWKLLSDWKLLIPGAIWIDASTGEVLT